MLTLPGYASFLRDDQAGDRREVVSFDFHIEQALDFSNLSTAENLVRVIAGWNDFLRLFSALVFIFDLADNFFQDVFNRDQPRNAAIFVDHHREIGVRFLHFAQEFRYRFRFRNEINRSNEGRDRRIGFAH